MTVAEISQKAWLRSAEKLAALAEVEGLVKTDDSLAHVAERMARIEMLARIIAESHGRRWFNESSESHDWQFGDVFGHITRLAIFEMSYGDLGLEGLRKLFRLYFGRGVENVIISAFLAATAHPGLWVSPKTMADIQNLVQAMSIGESVVDSALASGLLNGSTD